VVEAGEVYEHEGIRLRIVEVYDYQRGSGMRMVRVACVIVDGDYTTPVFYFWLRRDEDVREKIKQVVEHYKRTREVFR